MMKDEVALMKELESYLVTEALRSMQSEGHKFFDLSTKEGIKEGIHYYVDYHLKQRMEQENIFTNSPLDSTDVPS